jgi:hypothetical protein
MYTFIVTVHDTEYEFDRLIIFIDRKSLADFILNVHERWVIKEILVSDAEFGTNYREFCLPKSI